MIDHEIVQIVDAWIDANVGRAYQADSLGQDWARIAKVNEEIGEAIAEFILLTGQNPRKPQDTSPERVRAFLLEMADAAMTIVYGMQHFTKDVLLTEYYLSQAQAKHFERAVGE